NSPTPGTPNYYRLQWTDGNGDIAYSSVVKIASSLVSGVLDVNPNPFRDQLTVRLSLNSTQRVAIRLLDSKGMLVQQGQYEGVKGVNTFTVEGLSSLPASVYLVQIVLVDQIFVRKVFNTR
ncbi:MAG TPA: T9SS type A sorting domain-containing protein, partial [Puia sp.]|nr:T9SS type A sorting domain-containing protein [Puia sp.]